MIILTACIVVGGTNGAGRTGAAAGEEGELVKWWWNAEAPVPLGCCIWAELGGGADPAIFGANSSGWESR